MAHTMAVIVATKMTLSLRIPWSTSRAPSKLPHSARGLNLSKPKVGLIIATNSCTLSHLAVSESADFDVYQICVV